MKYEYLLKTTAAVVIVLFAFTAFIQSCRADSKEPGQESPSWPPGVLEKGFVYEQAPFPSCHASTIAETEEGFVCAWFGGKGEGEPDVGIWLSRHAGRQWSSPIQVADGVQDPNLRYPCWNPVLFQIPKGPLLLFFKVGPNPRQWWGMVKSSNDHGKTWSPASRLPNGILGPIKNKPVQLDSGIIISPSSTETDGWKAHVEISKDKGKNWEKIGPLNNPQEFGVIQPTILLHGPNVLQLLMRSRQGKITECWSKDGGNIWESVRATVLPNPNSGIDAVTLRDKRFLLVYNHTSRGRSPLNIAVSEDGLHWKAGPLLETEPGEYSYPAVIQGSAGQVHITYTWKRQRIRYVVLDPEKIQLREMNEGPQTK